MTFLLRKWLQAIKRKAAIGAPSRQGVKRARRQRLVLCLEALEDRSMLSTLTVTSAADDGTAGTLRALIGAANSGDTIQFTPSLAGQTITLTQGELNIGKSLDIEGLGANELTISGNNQSRVFDISVGTASVTLAGLTISNGLSTYAGGGIYNTGTLTVNSCTVSGNAAYSNGVGDDYGGAIYSFGTLTINKSTISGNQVVGAPAYASTYSTTGGGISSSLNPAGSGYGGGIYTATGTLTINSSTIANNDASGGSSAGLGASAIAGNGYGGGLFVASGAVSINNSTVGGNQAFGGSNWYSASPGYGDGGGINVDSPSGLHLYDTILAENTADSAPDLEGGFTSAGHNLIGNTTGGSGFAASDLVNVNPQLGPLQNNGSPTQTMALLPGSHAIDAGDNTGALAYDQRGSGFPRIVNGVIDIGAFEVQNSNPGQTGSLAVSGYPSSIQAGSAGTFTVTALNPDGSIDTSYTGTVYFTSSDNQAALPANYTFTAADAGKHNFSATLKTAGSQSLTAADTSTTGLAGGYVDSTVTPAGASQLAFAQQPSIATAGQAIGPAVTVDLEDAYGNMVSSNSSTVTVTLSSSAFAGGSATATAAASGGVATFSALMIDKAGSYTLTATDGSLTSAVSGWFTVTPTAASTLVVSGFLSPTSAGSTRTFTVTAEDPYGNVASGYAGTVHFTSSDGKAVLPANYTFTAANAGSVTLNATFKTAGTQSITATDTANASFTGIENGITVQPASASKFLLTGPSSVSAGVPFTATLTVEDAYGNIVTGYTGTVHFTSTDGRGSLPANYTFNSGDAGVHTFTLVLHKKGKQKFTVTDTSNSSLTTSDIVSVH
jgi:hypothetical protein